MAKDRKPSPRQNSNVQPFFDALERAELQPASQPVAKEDQIDIERELARRERIRNDDAEQDIRLKRSTLNRLFIFLIAETTVIFGFAFFQGAHWPSGFHLEEWSFKVIVGATIAQITAMLFVAVNYLFPKDRNS